MKGKLRFKEYCLHNWQTGEKVDKCPGGLWGFNQMYREKS